MAADQVDANRRGDRNPKIFPLLIVISIASIILLIAYASPYWVQSFDKSKNPFLNAGLWEFCWNDYTFPADFSARRYIGCFYVFSPEMYDFWEIVSPPWLVSCQVMYSLVVLLQIGSLLIVILCLFRCFALEIEYGLLFLIAFASICMTLLSFTTLIVYGVYKEDRAWMYRPDQNILSWAYGLVVINMIFDIVIGLMSYKAGKVSYDEDRKMKSMAGYTYRQAM